MLRAMYSAISGLKNFQTKLDVIGNNIANVSTAGFKKGRVTFADLVSQQLAGATAPNANRGGVNPKQVGLGSTIASIDTITTGGNTQTTGRPLDVAISGDGYFVVQDGGVNYYTRAGNFYLDEQGDLVNANGLHVIGYTIDANGNLTNNLGPLQIPKTITIGGTTENLTSFSIGTDGTIYGVLDDGSLQVLGQIALAQFNNPDGLQKMGNNLYINTANSGNPVIGTADAAGASLIPSALEMSNVDLSEEFTGMIEAERGFQANARVITTADQILQELVNLKRS
ncbi:flagellar basal body rod protein FlgG [Caenibacillus caldisaponilyticus]|uniref:flagellar basal body rod protein FlgG n=1 Tax=Caenibacillus caldisaponilyticus TaxID=1674942 RepID=UPI0009884F1E|nr:flagellar basal body rod protein FlgG [Caenibacillus caldisaponilyticus]